MGSEEEEGEDFPFKKGLNKRVVEKGKKEGMQRKDAKRCRDLKTQ